MSFSELCQSPRDVARGHAIIKSVFESVDDETKALLNMNDGEKAVVIERILAMPTMWRYRWKPQYIFPTFCVLLDEDSIIITLSECLREKHHLWFTHSRKMIELVYASFEVAHYLGVNEGYPLILIKSEMIDNSENSPAFRRNS
ncbi:UTRA domain-containing protein [Salmonella enterica subsp. enterica]|nr:UTRA domain-containing protein [Salmonella enterica subsp. enterica]